MDWRDHSSHDGSVREYGRKPEARESDGRGDPRSVGQVVEKPGDTAGVVGVDGFLAAPTRTPRGRSVGSCACVCQPQARTSRPRSRRRSIDSVRARVLSLRLTTVSRPGEAHSLPDVGASVEAFRLRRLRRGERGAGLGVDVGSMPPEPALAATVFAPRGALLDSGVRSCPRDPSWRPARSLSGSRPRPCLRSAAGARAGGTCSCLP